MKVRFFGGWHYQFGDDKGKDFAKVGYAKGVPMGGDLQARPEQAKAPTFLIWAEKDPDAANLDRIQIVKGWAKHGQSFEKIYNVAWSGGRSLDPKTGRLPSIGSTVDVAKATYSNTIGAEKLSAVWQDPDFDPTLRGFYYVMRAGDPYCLAGAHMTQKTGDHCPRPGLRSSRMPRVGVTDLVYPNCGRVGEGPREPTLTVASLEKKNIKALSTEEIKKLVIGKRCKAHQGSS